MKPTGIRKLIAFFSGLIVFVAIFILVILKAQVVDSALITALTGLAFPLASAIGFLVALFIGGNTAVHILGKKENAEK